MSQPYVSSYSELFTTALANGLEGLIKDDHAKLVADIYRLVSDKVISELESYVLGEMEGNLAGAIRSVAARQCEAMLRDALAGDDKELRNLFGFRQWDTKLPYYGEHPTEWKLLSRLIEANPTLFVDERLKQLGQEVECLKRDLLRCREELDNRRLKDDQ